MSPTLPVDPAAAEARRWLSDELAKSEYQRRRDPVLEFISWLRRLLADADGAPSGWGNVLLLVLAALLVTGVVLLVLRMRRSGRQASRVSASDTLADPRRTPDHYRRLAADAMARGDFDAAFVAAFRCLVAGMDRREIVADVPGLTAREAAERAARAFPAAAPRLGWAAGVFDVAAYGVAPAPRTDAAEVAGVLDLVTELERSTPVPREMR